MLYHWIDPKADLALQEGRDEDGPKKKAHALRHSKERGRAQRLLRTFRPEEHEYTKDALL